MTGRTRGHVRGLIKKSINSVNIGHNSVNNGINSVNMNSSIVSSSGLVKPCLGIFPLSTHDPSLQISYYSPAIILVSVSSSCFILVVPMREVSCVRYAPRHGISVPYSSY